MPCARSATGRNTYNELEGVSDRRGCLLCPLNSFTLEGATTSEADCICDSSYFKVVVNGSSRCDTCPEGAICSEPGTTLENLTLQSGYWRASINTIQIIRCPDASLGNSGCQGGIGAPCKPSLTGAYCRVCVEDWHYYDTADSTCQSCALIPPETIGMLSLATLLAVALVSQCALVARAQRAEARRGEALAKAAAAPRSVKSQASRTLALQELRNREELFEGLQSMRGLEGLSSMNPAAFGSSCAVGLAPIDERFSEKLSRRQLVPPSRTWSAEPKPLGGSTPGWSQLLVRLQSIIGRASISCKVRLLISFLQVTCQLEAVYLLSWPRELIHFMRQLEVIFSIDFVTLGLPLPCLGLRGIHAQLVAAGLAPGVIVCVILAANAVMACTASDEVMRKEGAVLSVGDERRSWLRERLLSTLQRSAGSCLFVLFFALPLVSSLAFRAFSCECFDDQQLCFLRADYALVCGRLGPDGALGELSPAYEQVRALAFLMITAYPVLVPLLSFSLLFKARHAIQQRQVTRLSRGLHFLHDAYEPRFFYWEVACLSSSLALLRP